jgi:ribosomal-protein-serine acetyltransferase
MKLAVDGRTQLRSFVDGDAPGLFALVDANRAYLRAWLPWLDSVRSVDDIRGFLRGVAERARAGTSLELAIVHEGELAGVAGFRALDAANRSGELGYWLRADRQGRGIVTGACRALARHGFESLGLNRVVLIAASGNAKSRQVAERLGFRLEGELREYEWLYDHFVDAALYALLRRDMLRE